LSNHSIQIPQNHLIKKFFVEATNTTTTARLWCKPQIKPP